MNERRKTNVVVFSLLFAHVYCFWKQQKHYYFDMVVNICCEYVLKQWSAIGNTNIHYSSRGYEPWKIMENNNNGSKQVFSNKVQNKTKKKKPNFFFLFGSSKLSIFYSILIYIYKSFKMNNWIQHHHHHRP